MPLSSDQQQEIMRRVLEAKSSGRIRGGMFRQLGRQFGPFGELLGMVADVLSGGRSPRQKEIEDAIRILSEQGFQVTPGGMQPPVQAPRGVRRAAAPPISTRRRPAAYPGRTRGIREEEWPEEAMVPVLPARIRGSYQFVPEDIEGLSPEIETPESSNVYSIQYDYTAGMLYVRFKSNSPVMGYKDMTSICTGREYRCGIRPHLPGPLYSYGGAGRKIPESAFEEFVSAASKGQWVWDNLRVCGSTWQHQVPYTLTSVPTENSYIPRKATRRGLRVRQVPVAGQGRRGARRSTLPEQIR